VLAGSCQFTQLGALYISCLAKQVEVVVCSENIYNVGHLKARIIAAIASCYPDVLCGLIDQLSVWDEVDYRFDVRCAVNSAHI